MKTISADKTYIDYWQEYGAGSKSRFGIRIWVDRCSAISKVGSENPILLGVRLELPIDLSRTVGQHSLNNILGEHMGRHPDSDLIAVLTGEKAFKDALE